MEPEWFNFFDSVRHGGNERAARFMVDLERSETNELDKCAIFFGGGWVNFNHDTLTPSRFLHLRNSCI